MVWLLILGYALIGNICSLIYIRYDFKQSYYDSVDRYIMETNFEFESVVIAIIWPLFISVCIVIFGYRFIAKLILRDKKEEGEENERN